MNLFARSLGGIFSDRLNKTGGLKARVRFLFACLFLEGIALMFFSQLGVLAFAIPILIVFSLFVQMSEGATYAIVPYINKRALGPVAGIVGAGGNFGAVMAGFLFKGQMPFEQAYLIVGALVLGCSFLAFAVRFSADQEAVAKNEMLERLAGAGD